MAAFQPRVKALNMARPITLTRARGCCGTHLAAWADDLVEVCDGVGQRLFFGHGSAGAHGVTERLGGRVRPRPVL
jgi:hypothetical protein